MSSNECFVCGSTLNVNPQNKIAKCSNQNCPAGGMFSFCGYCRNFSFSMAETPEYGHRCVNSSCGTYNLKREKCPSCGNDSYVNIKGTDICMWRKCPSNQEYVRDCFFCGNGSFLNFPDVKICTKSDCPKLLKTMDTCFFCDEYSFDIEKGWCENKECEQHGVKMVYCDACSLRSFVAEKTSGDYLTCMNPDCSINEEDMGQTFLSMESGYKIDIDESTPAGSPAGEGTDTVDLSGELGETLSDDPGTERMSVRDISGMDTIQDEPAKPSPTPEPALPENGGPLSTDQFEIPVGPPPTYSSSPEEPTDPTLQASAEPEPVPMPVSSPDTPTLPTVPVTAEEAGKPDPEPVKKDEALSAAEHSSLEPVEEIPQEEEEEDIGPLEFGDNDVLNAYTFLEKCIFRGGEYPFIMIIGLVGAGKTTYLTMLGEILSNRETRYYFPYSGINIKRFIMQDYVSKYDLSRDVLEDLSPRVLDLVYDYSIDSFSKTISKGRWPEHTAPEGAYEDVSTKFLLSEIARNRKSIAKIATVETSGEDYKNIIANIKDYSRLSEKQRPIQQVLNSMMDNAEGFIVLMDPGDDEKDETYHDLFLTVHENLQKRAQIEFTDRLDREIESIRAMSESGRSDLVDTFEDILKQRLESESGRRKLEEVGKRLSKSISELLQSLTDKDEAVLIGEGSVFLGKLENVVRQVNPGRFEKIQDRIRSMRADGGVDQDVIFSYYKGLCQYCSDHLAPVVEKWVLIEESDDVSREQMFESVIEEKARLKLFREFGLDSDFIINTGEMTRRFRNIHRFGNLKYISLVTTKCDMYPIIYPPEDYPKYKLPNCAKYLKDIRNFLRILGGDLRVYHASTTGYSVMRDIGRYPGVGNTLTPINIVEPVFDMLRIENDYE